MQLLVATTHLKAKAEGAALRREQISQLLGAVCQEGLGSKVQGVVVCGDFNEERDAANVFAEVDAAKLLSLRRCARVCHVPWMER